MSLFVHPDPQEPAGGFAFLELPEGSLKDSHVTVAVFDAFGERWLATSDAQGARIGIGDANWQSDQVEFGPYEVHRHDGAEWVRIGPEIVNKLEEYAPLRLVVAGQSHDVSWPDTIPPRAGAAVIGELQTVARKQAGQTPDRFVGRAEPEPEIVKDLPPPPDSLPEPPPVKPPAEDRKGSLLIPLLGLVLIALAVAAWYFWPEDSPAPRSEEPVAQSENPCTLAQLSALTGGFDVTAQAIRDCGTDVSADTALKLIEDAAKQEDPEALLLFGQLYDDETLDPRIENLIGLSFTDDPAQAVEYYDRAAKAGSGPAQAKRDATCARLSVSDATLARGAYDDFCVE